MTTLHDYGGVLGWPFGHFLLGSHTLMVTDLGSCVKWPLRYVAAHPSGEDSPTFPLVFFVHTAGHFSDNL